MVLWSVPLHRPNGLYKQWTTTVPQQYCKWLLCVSHMEYHHTTVPTHSVQTGASTHIQTLLLISLPMTLVPPQNPFLGTNSYILTICPSCHFSTTWGYTMPLCTPITICMTPPQSVFGTPWQESHENEHKPCELLVLFSSCGILSVGSRMDNRPWPRQTLPEPHDFTMTSFTSMTLHSPNDGSHLQLNRATSSLKDHIIIKSSSRVPQEVSSGIHWDPSKISGSRLASSPD